MSEQNFGTENPLNSFLDETSDGDTNFGNLFSQTAIPENVLSTQPTQESVSNPQPQQPLQEGVPTFQPQQPPQESVPAFQPQQFPQQAVPTTQPQQPPQSQLTAPVQNVIAAPASVIPIQETKSGQMSLDPYDAQLKKAQDSKDERITATFAERNPIFS